MIEKSKEIGHFGLMTFIKKQLYLPPLPIDIGNGTS
jgi:hypothetical protein